MCLIRKQIVELQVFLVCAPWINECVIPHAKVFRKEKYAWSMIEWKRERGGLASSRNSSFVSSLQWQDAYIFVVATADINLPRGKFITIDSGWIGGFVNFDFCRQWSMAISQIKLQCSNVRLWIALLISCFLCSPFFVFSIAPDSVATRQFRFEEPRMVNHISIWYAIAHNFGWFWKYIFYFVLWPRRPR